MNRLRKAPPPRFTIVQQRPDRRWQMGGALALAWGVSLITVWRASEHHAAPLLPTLHADLSQTRAQLRHWRGEAERLQEREATSRRSDQISRGANREMQGALAERESEISELRASLAFYERLMGPAESSRGLDVHSTQFVAEAGGTWRYKIVVTQSRDRMGINRGGLRFAIEGVRDGKFATIDWDHLHKRSAMPSQGYAFRYFQRMDGSVMLPSGFTPQRVRVSLRGEAGSVDRVFAWSPGRVVDTFWSQTP